MATSYSNGGGSGNRRYVIGSPAGGSSGGWIALVDGVNTGSAGTGFSGGAAGAYSNLIWDFKVAVIIDEAKWYQSTADPHGTWQWQGSGNAIDWTNIGASFTLGGATVQTHTTLNGNTTSYRYYRLLGISGYTSASPWLQEIEWKIDLDPSVTISYLKPYGYGNRTGVITTAQSTGCFAVGTTAKLIDGDTTANNTYFNMGAAAGHSLSFTFPTAQVIKEIIWIQNVVGTHGTWKLQGSNDGGQSWTDCGSNPTFTLGSAQAQTITAMSDNATAYLMYRLYGVSGNRSNGPWLYEIEFKLGVGGTIQLGEASIAGATAAGIAAVGSFIGAVAEAGGTVLAITGLRYVPARMSAAGTTVVGISATAFLSADIQADGITAVAVVGNTLLIASVSAAGTTVMAATGSHFMTAVVSVNGVTEMVLIVTLAGVVMHCYTGTGTPVVPEAPSVGLNYVF